MTVRWLTAFLDTLRTESAAPLAFWQQITASTLSVRRGSHNEFATLLPENGDPYLRAQDIDSGRAGCHLDVHVDDMRKHLAHAVSFGAGVVEDFGALVVLQSPGGLVFCLDEYSGEHVRPLPVIWPDGHQSLVDQLCVDVVSERFDDEVRFWSLLTGWQRRSGVLPEFEYLDRPAGIPLRLMFQRLGTAEPPRSGSAHLDLSCDDHQAEVTAHLGLGATLVRSAQQWVTLRDPAGREYCVTRRDPSTGRLP